MSSVQRSKLSVLLDRFIGNPQLLIQYRSNCVNRREANIVINEVSKIIHRVDGVMPRKTIEDYIGWSFGFNIIEG